jgi:hypothetical protein
MQTTKIIQWSTAALASFIFIGSGLSKMFGGEEAIQMAAGIGLSPLQFKALGWVEIISAVLFIIPRTGLVGTLLLAAYMGGAIAVHLTHDQPLWAPAIIEALVWIMAWLRYPELGYRFLGKNPVQQGNG